MAVSQRYTPPKATSKNFIIKPRGISGAAGLLALGGLYLVYAGVKDVPIIDGLRQIASGKSPASLATNREPHQTRGRGGRDLATGSSGSGGSGDLGLISCARAALPILRTKFGNLTMYGRAARPDNPTSDHPKGLAIDVMTTNALVHAQIVSVARTLPGFKYYCSDLVPGGANCPGNRHRDHVHISFHDSC